MAVMYALFPRAKQILHITCSVSCSCRVCQSRISTYIHVCGSVQWTRCALHLSFCISFRFTHLY